MKALRLYSPYDLRLVEEAQPVPAAVEVLLKVCAVTICHSDVHYYRDGRIGDTISSEPLVLGHEFSARVIQLPPHVEHLHLGDLVAVDPAVNCGHCRECREGNPNICANLLFSGTPPLDGAMREYLTYRPDLCYPLPDSFSPEEGALLEPLGVALYAWDLGHMRLAETVAIVGCGPIGLLLVQLARLAGASQVLAVEPIAFRRNMAALWGAIPLAPDESLDAEVNHLTGGQGVDVVIEVAGTLDGQLESARLAKRGGRVVLVGIPSEDRIEMPHHIARRKDLDIHVARRMKHTYPRAITLVEKGMISLQPLITHHFSLEQAADAFPLVANYTDDVIKAAIMP